ncbi:rhamnulokinase family protein [Microbacterium sp. ZW T5_56]|uniref:rhamnulokinase n=1 Tax=Microbacterium sp. ZW T5_56 TaxID=3378081 RepID=UPI003855418C
MTVHAAIDLGASSGRVIMAEVTPQGFRLDAPARFENPVVREHGSLRWDITRTWASALTRLAEAHLRAPIDSVGVDTWGVDYGIVRDGLLTANPHHYRDERTAEAVAAVAARLDPTEQFRISGVEPMPINTIYQLADDVAHNRLHPGDSVLLTADLFSSWLSGVQIAERTLASTTGLIDTVSRSWDPRLVDAARIPAGVLAELVDAGTVLGRLTLHSPVAAAASELPAAAAAFASRPPQVVAVAAHDTASAVVATPLAGAGSAYISCGTWGLVGVETNTPALSDAARRGGFTNELGADGRVLLQRNSMGTFILTESLRTWREAGHDLDLTALLEAAASAPVAAVFDVDDPRFSPPGDMPSRIAAWYRERGLPAPSTPAEVCRAIVESLAHAFAEAAHAAADLAGTPLRTIHVVGGGSQNVLLCRLLAQRAGVAVEAGPVEATAIGNLLVQARAIGTLTGDVDALRALIRTAVSPIRYEPR